MANMKLTGVITNFILISSAVFLVLVFIPIYLGYELLVENEGSITSLNITKSMTSTAVRDSLICSASFLLAPIIEILVDLIPDEREKNLSNQLFKLIRLLSSFCPNLVIAATSEIYSYTSIYPAIYASQLIILLAISCVICLQDGSSFWRLDIICGGYAFGMLGIFCKCYSAYFFSNTLSIAALTFLGITYFAYTIQFILYIWYIYNNYTKYSIKLPDSVYICCVHMFSQEIYTLFLFVISLTKDGLRWQDASPFYLCSKIYSFAIIHGFVSIFYDRLVQRHLWWTQASLQI